MAETRKIAAILVADIVGYSRLAGADEDRTLSRLRGRAAIRSILRSTRITGASSRGRRDECPPPRAPLWAESPAILP